MEKQNINTFKIGLKYTKDRDKGGKKLKKYEANTYKIGLRDIKQT